MSEQPTLVHLSHLIFLKFSNSLYNISLLDINIGGAQLFFVQLATVLVNRGHSISYFMLNYKKGNKHFNQSLIKDLGQVANPVTSSKELLDNDIIHLDGFHSLRRKIPFLLNLDKCVETYHSKYSLCRSKPVLAKYRVAVSQYIQQIVPSPSTTSR